MQSVIAIVGLAMGVPAVITLLVLTARCTRSERRELGEQHGAQSLVAHEIRRGRQL